MYSAFLYDYTYLIYTYGRESSKQIIMSSNLFFQKGHSDWELNTYAYNPTDKERFLTPSRLVTRKCGHGGPWSNLITCLYVYYILVADNIISF